MIIKKTAAVILTAGLLFANTGAYASSIIYALNPDPVSCAMADAGVALISNVMTGTIINPASTVGLYRTVASVGGSNITGDIQYNFASIGFATSIGIFGASLMYVDYNTDKYYDNAGTPIIGMGKTTDMGAILTYALPIRKYLPVFIDNGGVGINFKIMRSTLADYISETLAVDIGGILTVPKMRNFTVGFALKNLGTSEKFVKTPSELPQMMTVGLGYSNLDFYNLKLALDFTDQKQYEDFTSLGFSISPVYFMTLRAGVKFGGDSLLNNTRMGVGLQFQTISFDYAFIPSLDLNATHTFNLSFAFGSFSNQRAAYEYYLNEHFRQAQANFYAKDFVKARQQFDDILSVYPDHRPSQEYLKKTIDELEKIDDYNFSIVNKYMKKANKAREANNIVKADKYYRKVLALDPENRVAKSAIEDIETATNDVKALQDRDINSDRIVYLWGRYQKFYKKGDLVRAKNSLKYLLDIDPQNALAKEKMVDVDNQLSKIASDKANEIYDQAMKYYNKGNYEEAIKYFEAVIVAAPHRLDVRQLIDKSEQNIQEIAEYKRLTALEKEQDKVKGKLVGYFEDGLKNYEKGRYEAAVEYFKKAKEIAEKYEFNEYYKNANNYISKMSFSLSEEYYKKGFNAFRENEFEKAAQFYKKSLEYNPGNTSATFELERVAESVAQKYYEEGMNAYSSNDMEKAREYLRKALYYKPDKAEAKRALDRIR